MPLRTLSCGAARALLLPSRAAPSASPSARWPPSGGRRIRRTPSLPAAFSAGRGPPTAPPAARDYDQAFRAIESDWLAATSTARRASSLAPSAAPSLEPSAAARPRYLLTMFPYPSGQLHMGHLRVYTLPDVLARYHRQRGRRVFFPIGWDAFGLPAENAARQHGVDPEAWTRRNIAEMREVLQDIGIAFDWDHEVATCDADYYRWTQWLFLQLYRHGYVYRKRALVNWDPVDQTVLANEQIDTHGRAERSGAQVELRPMTQWFVAMRRKVPELLRDLDLLQWPQNVKTLQRDWIGAHPAVTQPITVLPVAGTPLSASPSAPPPEPLGLAVVLTPEAHERFLAGDACAVHVAWTHPLLDNTAVMPAAQREALEAQLLAGGAATLGSEDRFRSSDASDSSADAAEARRLPLEAVVPADRRGALKRVPVSAVLQTDVLESPAVVVWRDGSCQRESEPAGESDSEDRSMAPPSSAMAPAQPTTLYHLRDWLVSRQRRWGTPIPIIHCEASCGPVPVPDEHLPFHPATATLRHCPQCGSDAIRYETDTLDTFVDSSWYWLRYLDPRNDRQLAAPEILAKALPVDLYVGGVEHAIMHLLYARFFYKFIMTDLDLAGWRALPRRDAPAGPVLNANADADAKAKANADPAAAAAARAHVLKTRAEPFPQLLAQGMVLGKTYRAAGSGRYLTRAQQAAYESRAAAASPAPSDGAAAPDGAVVVTYEKMSKSKFNGVAPTDTVARWGRDVTRLYMLVRAPPADDLKWDESAIIGMARWLRRVHHLGHALVPAMATAASAAPADAAAIPPHLAVALHETLVVVENVLENDFAFPSAINALIILFGKLEDDAARAPAGGPPLAPAAWTAFVQMLHPFAPALAWHLARTAGLPAPLGWPDGAAWAAHAAQGARAAGTVRRVIVNGRVVGSLDPHAAYPDDAALRAAATAHPGFAQWCREHGVALDAAPITKTIIAGKGTVVSLVVRVPPAA
ncbi:hypothetical protein CXG81DRAFT_18977 [Caulochytrium protostelioides]|uniref:leucine--tRNA ligase n=1 Tax=Caulochytrium protostelioides TaxID=1555241 RepID=A0A4P9X7I4_9FUNG|nr:hypothetical protein CXG81DRAFT_18977 [Caulochytrium protostelioides]|eukprot:RKP01204.1 hypothetical protein CXG81DRAFT_18977 [Caulochytrium protostelioides]